jgi:uncharacterized membrane protein
MAKITKSVTINAPVEKVFAFISEPTNLPEIWSSMVEVKDVQPSPAGGYNFDWVYKMAGVRFNGASETTESVTNQCIVTKSTKGIESKFVWTFETKDSGTKLTVETEYSVPVPLLGKLAEAFIVKQNEHEADVLLANLKARMEV